MALVSVMPPAPGTGPLPALPAPSAVRRYYIGAVVQEWDYSPLGSNGCTGEPFGEGEDVFLAGPIDASDGPVTNARIGPKYLKARFVEYTDGSFTTVKPPPASEAHKGVMGPVLRAEVGQLLRVTLRNINVTGEPAHANAFSLAVPSTWFLCFIGLTYQRSRHLVVWRCHIYSVHVT